jgi:hypothetical protein
MSYEGEVSVPDSEPLSEEALAGLRLGVDTPGTQLNGMVKQNLQLSPW